MTTITEKRSQRLSLRETKEVPGRGWREERKKYDVIIF